MPIVEVTHDPHVAEETLQRLAQALPHAISLAVECPEEPYDGTLRAGDVDIRFRSRSPFDSGGLQIVVEVRSKWFASREETRQQRCDVLRDALAEASNISEIGVYLSLPVAAWAQGE
ncbi:hypothetical protein [Nocardioides antri]|uniref:Tautomerase family protein n=1 Tax=Nocardioides antri TaxID=2607659 RepID=A0A5B1LU62_9ACTN|nr:hypothetical protein [Nocardioides antri]KAA1423157.1 hypothetical protein F0U47_20295 [Nocardioides antri]